MSRERERLSSELLSRIMASAPPGTTVATVANGRPNRIVDVGPNGVLVETERTDRLGTGPQLVPAALLMADWSTLESSGSFPLREASHRGSFACALFATFPDVSVASTRPVRLVLRRRSRG